MKFRDKYLLCVFSHNKFPKCDEMDSRTASSGGFSYGFNTAGHFIRRARQWACAVVEPIEQ